MASLEHINGQPRSPSAGPERVMQPQSRETVRLDLSNSLGSILEEVNRISETAAAGPGEQWSGGGSTAATTATGGSSGSVSARQQAIANLPPPQVMQKQLEKHIAAEVKKLRKEAWKIARMSRPGAAHRLNIIYARIRNLNSLLSELLQASYEVIQRFFIRVFIDKQQIL